MRRRVIVVGGDAAGMSAASQMRRVNADLDVVVFERGEHVSYGACGIPHLIAGRIPAPEDLLALSPEQIAQRGIEVRRRHEVRRVRPRARTVEVVGPDGAASTQRYDYLVLATGAVARVPDWEGVDLGGVFTLRTLQDGITLGSFVAAGKPASAVVVGTGYVGLEMAEALQERGLAVTLLGRSQHVLSGLDPVFATPVLEALRARGVQVLLGHPVQRLEGTAGRVTAVVTQQGRHATDLVVLALGVRPNAGLAREAGIALGRSGAVAVDDRMRTDAPGVWAAGDCIEVPHVVTGQKVYLPLALTANRTGRIAGDNLAADALGRLSPQRFRGTTGSLVTTTCGFVLARTGLTVQEARSAGLEAVPFERRSLSRAAYYPGAEEIRTRIVVDRHTRRLLGAEMLGREGVAGRIDVFAAALAARLTVDDVYHLDLAYAPPFGPVWDPVIEICGRAALEI
ncbi:MAG: FAD-dependent oxidoreductase [Candidatus Latescibacterota bacterium]